MRTHTTPAGVVVPILTREEMRALAPVNSTAPAGLGTFAIATFGMTTIWCYLSPRHGVCHASHPDKEKKVEPPPLPRPNPVRCGCSEREHVCGSCGQPYWIEVHGMADGYCSYCYARG